MSTKDHAQQFTLRPLSVSEIIDRAFFLFRSRFLDLLTISAATYVPLTALSAVLLWSLWTHMLSFFESDQLSLPSIVALTASGFVMLLIWTLGAAAVYAALAHYISNLYLGRQIQPLDAYAPVLRCLAPLLLTWLILTLLVTAGIFLCLIPGIYLAVATSFAWPIVVIERRSAASAS